MAYPSGNSVLIEGTAEVALIDPSVTVVERGGAPVAVDAVINSHGHEDHMPGNGLFSDSRLHIHHDDLPGRPVGRRADGGVRTGRARPGADFTAQVMEEFFYTGRDDAEGFDDGHVFDLGGVRIEGDAPSGSHPGPQRLPYRQRLLPVRHRSHRDSGPTTAMPGPTSISSTNRCGRSVRWSADWYVTYHHKGIIEGRNTFVEMVDNFHAVIDTRHERMLEFLVEPHTLGRHGRPSLRLPAPRRARLSRGRGAPGPPSCTWPE